MISSSGHNNAYTERAIQHTQSLLADSGVQASLGSRYPRLQAVADNLFIPNVRNGQIEVPREYVDTDSYPVVTLKVGESVKNAFLPPTPAQLDVGEQALKAMVPRLGATAAQIVGLINARFAQVPTIISRMQGNMAASCLHIWGTAGLSQSGFVKPGNTRRQVMSRPAVALVEQPGYVGRHHPAPEALIHEMTHIDQRIDRNFTAMPERPRNQLARDELEAHHVGATVLTRAIDAGIVDTDHLVVQRAIRATLTIEAIRRAHNSDDNPFAVTTALLADLDKAGLKDAVVQKNAITTIQP